MNERFVMACEQHDLETVYKLKNSISSNTLAFIFSQSLEYERYNIIILLINEEIIETDKFIIYIISTENTDLLFKINDFLNKNILENIFYQACVFQKISIMNALIRYVSKECLEYCYHYVVLNLKINSLKFLTEKIPFDTVQNFFDNMK